nr:MAG TPA: hypothetical protein [Caudoviricetes sp.]
MNKTVTAVLAISALAVNVAGATSNNTVGGTDNTISTNSTSSMVSGFQNHIDANNALAFGTNNSVTGENGFAGGNNAKASGRNSFAFGAHAEALVEYTTAIGSQARTSAYNTIAIGNGAYASGPSALAIGTTTKSQSDNTIALGSSVTTALNNSVGIGSIVNANGVSSVAIGHTVSTEGTSAVNIGNNNIGASKYSTLVGSYNIIDHTDHLEDPEGDTLIGSTNIVQDGYYATILGKDNEINNANYAVAVGRNASVTSNESVAIGHEAKANTVIGTSSYVINNNTYNFVGTAPVGTVSVGDANKERTITNLSAGRISDNSTDAVNGSQLFATINAINTNGNQIDSIKSRVDRHDQRIDYLQDNIADHSARISELERNQNNLTQEFDKKLNSVNQRVNKLGASATALAGLHPLDFNRNDKVSYAISYGHYRNSNAVALGAFIRTNERLMIGVGATLGAENQYTINLAFKTGKGSDYLAEAKDAQSRISKLEALVAKLMAEVEK